MKVRLSVTPVYSTKQSIGLFSTVAEAKDAAEKRYGAPLQWRRDQEKNFWDKDGGYTIEKIQEPRSTKFVNTKRGKRMLALMKLLDQLTGPELELLTGEKIPHVHLGRELAEANVIRRVLPDDVQYEAVFEEHLNQYLFGK